MGIKTALVFVFGLYKVNMSFLGNSYESKGLNSPEDSSKFKPASQFYIMRKVTLGHFEEGHQCHPPGYDS